MRPVPLLSLCCTLLLLLLTTTAEGLPLDGRVTDGDTGEAVAGALVHSGRHTSITDADGRFHLDIETGDSVVVTHVGYHPVRIRPDAPVLQIELERRLLVADEVVVQAGLRRQALSQVPASVQVVTADQLAAGELHLQDLIDGMANLHWTGGTSRPRYFQIRGIGERSQYAGEGPPTFAVGFVVDDVELSGLGTTAMLFDMAQVEVFKGPQSTVFGPDAMAGLISMQSADPATAPQPQLRASLGSDGLQEVGAAANVALFPGLAARISYSGSRADGFRDNVYLRAHDSNARREQMLRAKVVYQGDGDLRLAATLFHGRANNGYDAWAPDNNPDFITYSDNPGRDDQRTTGFSLRATVPLAPSLQLLSITSWSATDVEYSYDGDWGNDEYWQQQPFDFDAAVQGWRYDFFDRTLRQRSTWTQEARLLAASVPGMGGEGVVGVYAKRLREEDDATGYLFGGEATDLASTFDIANVAFYGQWQRPLSRRIRLSGNVRLERYGTDYDGRTNGGAERVRFDTDDWLTGGRLALSTTAAQGQFFAAISRGYRPGGVNQHPRLSAAHRPYDAEILWNVETGCRWHGARGALALTLFHARRRSQQVELSSQQDPGDPNSFVYFTANAGSGWNGGAELEGQYRLVPSLRLSVSAGWLLTYTDAYTFATAQGRQQTLGDRAAANAPAYGFRLGADYSHASGLLAQLTLSATDSFYYSDSHDQRADAYLLLHGSLGYAGDGWSLRLWGRNLLDERYTTRGFFFGLEPPAYQERLYVSYGDPRQIGITLSTNLGRGSDD